MIKETNKVLSNMVMFITVFLIFVLTTTGVKSTDYLLINNTFVLDRLKDHLAVENFPLAGFTDHTNLNIMPRNGANPHARRLFGFLGLYYTPHIGFVQYLSSLVLSSLVFIILIDMLIIWEQKKDGKKRAAANTILSFELILFEFHTNL